MSIFLSETAEMLRICYPEHPVRLRHSLHDHPLLEIGALVSLAGRIRRCDAEYNRGNLPVGIDPDATPANGLSPEETLRSIESCDSWMVLKFVDQDPEYRALLDELLDEIEPQVLRTTGRMLKREAFIFVSSPGSVTPFHFDPEHNILMQVRGEKVMTVFPAGDAEIAPGTEHERFHAGGHRNLPWDDGFAPRGRCFRLKAGEAVYVPVKAPHWVKNGPAVSVSLSITWRSEWSYREEQAHRFNGLLRKVGINPAMPGRYPEQNRARSIAYRAIGRAGRMVRGGGEAR